jgi:hypothetical protein
MKKTIIFGLILTVLAFTVIVSVHSQNLDGQNLAVFPAIQEELVKPGEKTRIQIQFKNGGNTALVGKLKVVDFVVADKQGTPKIVENGLVPKYGAASWISLPNDSVAIPPRDYVSLDLGVNVPYDVTTCAKYALVYFEPAAQVLKIGATTQRPQSATSVSSRLGGIIIFNLENGNNNCKENLNISGLTASKFQEFGPIKVNFDIFNLSDYHIVPAGFASLSNLIGYPVDQKTISEQRIFPDAAKSYEVQLGSKWMIGRYKVLLNATSNGLHSVMKEQAVYVWVFPWRAALVVILTLIVIILLVKNLYHSVVNKEANLEEEVKKEQEEIDKLKSQLRKRG